MLQRRLVRERGRYFLGFEQRSIQMAFFQNSFFKSKDKRIEDQYEQGVRHLRAEEYVFADACFRAAAEKGHVSASYNLFILNGAGHVSPYDIDFAAKCFRAAADAGHPTASQQLFMLEAADRGGFGTNNLVQMAATTPPQDGLSAQIMVFGSRFFHAVSEAHDATDAVIAYELKYAARSDHAAIINFISRTGVPSSFYNSDWADLEEGSAADEITDGLNHLSFALRSAGNTEEMAALARCTILGYMISKSRFGSSSAPLRAIPDFFK